MKTWRADLQTGTSVVPFESRTQQKIRSEWKWIAVVVKHGWGRGEDATNAIYLVGKSATPKLSGCRIVDRPPGG